MKLNELNIKVGDLISVGFYEIDGFLLTSVKDEHTLSVIKHNLEVIYSDNEWICFLTDKKYCGTNVDEHLCKKFGLEKYLGNHVTFIHCEYDYNYLALSKTKDFNCLTNGSNCIKCNRYNEYVTNNSYICYECR